MFPMHVSISRPVSSCTPALIWSTANSARAISQTVQTLPRREQRRTRRGKKGRLSSSRAHTAHTCMVMKAGTRPCCSATSCMSEKNCSPTSSLPAVHWLPVEWLHVEEANKQPDRPAIQCLPSDSVVASKYAYHCGDQGPVPTSPGHHCPEDCTVVEVAPGIALGHSCFLTRYATGRQHVCLVVLVITRPRTASSP